MKNIVKSLLGCVCRSSSWYGASNGRTWLLIILYLLPLHQLFLNESTTFSQSQWQVAIGGPGEDVAYSIIQTTDGGYAIAGTSISYGGWYIVKLNAIGNLQWTKVLSGTDHAYSIIKTMDGGFAVCGEALWEFCMVKFDSLGNMQWNKTVGGPLEDRAYGVVQTTDGGYIMGGWARSFGIAGFHYYVVKLSSGGNFLWNRIIGGPGSEYASSITATSDGGCALAGYTNSYGNQLTDMFIVKLNAAGTLEWSRTIGRGTYYNDAKSIIQTSDGGYAVAGETTNSGTSGGDFYIVKLNNAGNLQWTRTVGGTATDIAWSIVQTTDGGYSVVGGTPSFGAGMVDLYLVKLNSSGSLQWSKTVGGPYDDYIYDLIQTTDGGYAAVGYTHSFGVGNYDFYIVKLSSTGSICGSSTSPGSQSGTGGDTTSPTPTVISPTPTIGNLSTSITTSGTVTIICYVGIKPISTEVPENFQLYQNYPNPFNTSTNFRFQIAKSTIVSLIIYDILGNQVAALVNNNLNPGTYEVNWDAASFASGVYYCNLLAGTSFSETKQMVLVK